ncbi:hypothetical protein EK21DRAFT_69078, partial [Setomelanomma holmii]
LTARQLRITGSCVGAAKTSWDIRTAWKLAPATASTLCSQVKLTAASLSQIQALLLLQDSDVLRDKPDPRDTFDTTLTSCLVLSTWLEKIMLKITKGILDVSKATWKAKFQTLWNEHEVKELSEQLTTQQGGISVLVGLLQMNSISEIRRMIHRHDALIREIAKDTRALRRTHAIDAPASIFSTDDDTRSGLSQLKDIEQDNTFETVILSSKVYSQAEFKARIQPIDWPEDPAQGTISEAKELVLHDPQLRTTFERLGIFDVAARSKLDHVAQRNEEISLQNGQWITKIKKCSDWQYEGEIQSDLPDIPSLRGRFDRNKVFPHLDCGNP